MSEDPSSIESEHRRKRLRKGTRSCWECKRRKIRCQLSSEDVPSCSGCVARGTRCISQEYPEEEISTSSNYIGGRLGRVEQLLETLVAKISQCEEEAKIMTPESLGTDGILPTDLSNVSSNPHIQATAPFLALFDNTALGRREIDQSQAPTPTSQSGTTKSCGGSRTPKIERIRQALLELLPSQHDMDLIYNASSFWLSFHAFSLQGSEGVIPGKFDVVDISKGSITSIARTLLYISSCLLQLHPDFDTARLKLYPSVESRMERYVSTVQALVTSDEELVSSIEGIDCLILQCSYHSNAGNPRRAWLTVRRAMNIAQLMGLHLPSCTIPGGKETWANLVQGDRYLALLLGLPAGSKDVGCGLEETFENPNTNKDDMFAKTMFNIAGRIIERNQNEQAHTYTTTQEIDEEFENLAAKMPKEWWDVPEEMLENRSLAAVAQFGRFIFQITYFQFVALLHLPFMLRAAKERRYEYSKFSCMKASREMIHRYLALRNTAIGTFRCRIIDFGAFTVTVILFLGLLESSASGDGRDQQHQRDSDRHLVEMVLQSMEHVGRSGKDLVANQSANAIKSLLAIDSPSGQNTTNLKLSIPYFGTISIVRPLAPPPPIGKLSLPTTQPAVTAGYDLTSQRGENIPFHGNATVNAPLVSFTSSQFSSAVPEQMPIEGWKMSDADTMFFDSLLNQDLAMMDLPPHVAHESHGW